MAPIDSLPPELLAEVFSSFPPENHREALLHCSLVCRGWRELAQEALFGTVELDGERDQRWLASPALPRYSTRHLNLNHEEGTGLLLGLKVLRRCPGLVSLHVGVVDGDGDGGHEWCHCANAQGECP